MIVNPAIGFLYGNRRAMYSRSIDHLSQLAQQAFSSHAPRVRTQAHTIAYSFNHYQYCFFCDQYKFVCIVKRTDERELQSTLYLRWHRECSLYQACLMFESSYAYFAFAPSHYISSIFKLEFCCKTYCFFCKTHSINHLQMIQSQINVYTSI